jgi:sugar (pentulose or hexulose) kinase
VSKPGIIVVIDIGKTNAKLVEVDPATRAVGSVRTTANTVRSDGPYPHFDTAALWRWLLDGLADIARQNEVATISVTAHGACAALTAGERLSLPIIDYEYDGPEEVRAAYRTVCGDFKETLSPDLPNGLNVGRQLFWLSRKFPERFAETEAILPYPQYWVWRLTGRKVSEVTTIGCHTDLWVPQAGTFSRFAIREGWDRLFPPLVKAWDTVGPIAPEVARRTGLSAGCRVVAGIHDSNASLLPHLLTRSVPFAVLSTGTWAIVLAPGGSIEHLDPDRDCLANVDAFGRPVPSTRFMAGREFAILTEGSHAEPTDREVSRVVVEGIMALPTFAPGNGPFGKGKGHWTVDPAGLSPGERVAAASLYSVMVTEACLALTGAAGPVIVEGPFARNRLFLSALAQRIPRPLLAEPDATGTVDGAALLAEGPDARLEPKDAPAVAPLAISLTAYAEAWRGLAAQT